MGCDTACVELTITGVQVNNPAFAADLQPVTLAPGGETTFTVSYAPSGADDEGLLQIRSNDPDEDPLPIQVFGRTPDLDPDWLENVVRPVVDDAVTGKWRRQRWWEQPGPSSGEAVWPPVSPR